MLTSLAQTLPRFGFKRSESKNQTVANKTPGNIAVWLLIYAELSEFALFFIIFLIAKVHHPDIFSAGPARLNTMAGMLNTIVLVTSSYFITKAVTAIKLGDKKTCLKWLYLTLLAGATYCGIKGWEYVWNDTVGIHSRTNLFYSFYYYLTFNHLLHVLIGMTTIFWVTLRTHFNTYSASEYEGLESAAFYWHMIDLAWIIIFPLVYVLR